MQGLANSSMMGNAAAGGLGVHHHRNHASNQSANVVVRGMAGINLMNYSILQSELDTETTSLEDMHMFFVAFNHRQNKIVQLLEKAEMVHAANDRGNLLMEEPSKESDKDGGDKSEGPMNVIILKNEVDLE